MHLGQVVDQGLWLGVLWSERREAILSIWRRTLRWRSNYVAELLEHPHCFARAVADGGPRLVAAPLNAVGPEDSTPGRAWLGSELLFDHLKYVLDRRTKPMAARGKVDP